MMVVLVTDGVLSGMVPFSISSLHQPSACEDVLQSAAHIALLCAACSTCSVAMSLALLRLPLY